MNRCMACGKPMIAGRQILPDGTYLCRGCFSRLPEELKDYALTCWKAGDYFNCIEYLKYQGDKLKPVFKKTYSYGSLQLDEENGLYKFSNGQGIYKLEYASNIAFSFQPEKLNQGMLTKQYAVGKSYVMITSHMPKFSVTVELSSAERASGMQEKGRFISRMPDKMIETDMKVRRCLDRLYRQRQEKEEEKQQERFEQKKQEQRENREEKRREERVQKKDRELFNAMALFMLDSLDGLGEADIKKQRNRLLKTFHPDEGEDGSEFAQKINKAYEILIKELKAAYT